MWGSHYFSFQFADMVRKSERSDLQTLHCTRQVIWQHCSDKKNKQTMMQLFVNLNASMLLYQSPLSQMLFFFKKYLKRSTTQKAYPAIGNYREPFTCSICASKIDKMNVILLISLLHNVKALKVDQTAGKLKYHVCVSIRTPCYYTWAELSLIPFTVIYPWNIPVCNLSAITKLCALFFFMDVEPNFSQKSHRIHFGVRL